MIKAFIFDLDGVVIDSISQHFHAWRRLFKEYGVDFTWNRFKEINGMKGRDAAILYRKRGIKWNVNTIPKTKASYVDESQFRLFPDVKRLFAKLKKDNFRTALATSVERPAMKRLLKRFGLNRYFNAVVNASDVNHSKPFPHIFLTAARKIKTPAKHCVVIEDAVNGVKAAKNAGMKCIAVTGSFNKKELRKAGADLVVRRLNEINLRKINEL